jgi:hypothetical protein
MLYQFILALFVLIPIHVSYGAESEIEVGQWMQGGNDIGAQSSKYNWAKGLESHLNVVKDGKKVIYFNNNNTIAIGLTRKNIEHYDWGYGYGYDRYDLHCTVAHLKDGDAKVISFKEPLMNVSTDTNVNIWVDESDGIPRFHNGLLCYGSGDAIYGPFIENSDKICFYYTSRYVAYAPVKGKKYTFYLDGREEVQDIDDIENCVPKIK